MAPKTFAAFSISLEAIPKIVETTSGALKTDPNKYEALSGVREIKHTFLLSRT